MADPYYADDSVTLYAGDCLDVLRELPDASVDSVVTDPPYGLEFMGRAWDSFGRGEATSAAVAGMARTGYTDGADRLERPSFMGGTNPRCRSCGKWQRGGNPCACDEPDFPNERRARSASFGEWCEQWAAECLRVLKPGGHLLAFGGTRTWHRLACAIEDAGFEVRDSIAWLYGSGFPKSLDVSKAIDRAAGAEREVVGIDQRYVGMSDRAKRALGTVVAGESPTGFSGDPSLITAPATDDARTWQGWGTALKPAFEPVVVARKPITGTVAANVLAWGTGALNIDATRIEGDVPQVTQGLSSDPSSWEPRTERRLSNPHAAGRWPANVVLDESQAAELDRQSGETSYNPPATWKGGTDSTEGWGSIGNAEPGQVRSGFGDRGGASRFFKVIQEDSWTHDPASTAGETSSPRSASDGSAPDGAAISEHPDTAKPTDSPSTSGTPSASRQTGASDTPTPRDGSASSPEQQRARRTPTRSRASGAEPSEQTDTTTTTTSPSTSSGSADPATFSGTSNSTAHGVPLDELGSRFTYVAKAPTAERPRGDGIAHPTVKPLDLMRWLVRLVTPPGGVVLEPFAGSGTTAEACVIEGFRCIAIEREPDYLPLIVQRLTKPIQPTLFGGDVA